MIIINIIIISMWAVTRRTVFCSSLVLTLPGFLPMTMNMTMNMTISVFRVKFNMEFTSCNQRTLNKKLNQLTRRQEPANENPSRIRKRTEPRGWQIFIFKFVSNCFWVVLLSLQSQYPPQSPAFKSRNSTLITCLGNQSVCENSLSYAILGHISVLSLIFTREKPQNFFVFWCLPPARLAYEPLISASMSCEIL